ncbi:hypothetical protein Save01_05387 [Streptomyces avermitilis]
MLAEIAAAGKVRQNHVFSLADHQAEWAEKGRTVSFRVELASGPAMPRATRMLVHIDLEVVRASEPIPKTRQVAGFLRRVGLGDFANIVRPPYLLRGIRRVDLPITQEGVPEFRTHSTVASLTSSGVLDVKEAPRCEGVKVHGLAGCVRWSVTEMSK